jgi:hypothetical protein
MTKTQAPSTKQARMTEASELPKRGERRFDNSDL